MKKIAVDGCTVEITDPSIKALEIEIITQPSKNSFIDDKGIYCGTLTVVLNSLTYNGYSLETLTLTINGSSKNSTIDGQSVVLEGDESKNLVPSTFTAEAEPPTIEGLVNIRITKANQDVTQSD